MCSHCPVYFTLFPHALGVLLFSETAHLNPEASAKQLKSQHVHRVEFTAEKADYHQVYFH